MKAARLGRIPAHDKDASHAIQFPRAIRKNASAMLTAAYAATFAHKAALPL